MSETTRRLEILIVEDDPIDLRELQMSFDENPDDFCVISVTNNSTKAYEMVLKQRPHVVILDLELHAGGGDGLEFLKNLKLAELPDAPYVLVTTNNISAVTHKAARDLGADFIMTKSQKNYSATYVTEFLKTIKATVMGRKARCEGALQESPTEAHKRLRRKIYNELNKVGISPKLLGYEYLADAIELVYNGTTQHICEIIAKDYKKTEGSVERAMQNAINRTWNRSDPSELYSNFTAKVSSDKGVPTITEFIFFFAQRIKSSY